MTLFKYICRLDVQCRLWWRVVASVCLFVTGQPVYANVLRDDVLVVVNDALMFVPAMTSLFVTRRLAPGRVPVSAVREASKTP